MSLGWDAYLDHEIERHMGGEAEHEPAVPRCADCYAEEVPLVTLDGSPWCRSCVRAAMTDMTETERAEAVAALEESAL
jgi:hypothetical protein